MTSHFSLTILAFATAVTPVLAGNERNQAASEESFQFTHRISPILAKLGCSAAECHGSATGRGGFKLSLFADNPRFDYETITQELGGRRLDYVNPANSLFLRKPTRQGMKHKGGDHELAVADFVHNHAADDDPKAKTGETGTIDIS